MIELQNTAKHGIYDTVENGSAKIRVQIPAGEKVTVVDGTQLADGTMPRWVYDKFMAQPIAKKFKKNLKVTGDTVKKVASSDEG